MQALSLTPMQAMIIALVISFVITWVVGLAPALLVRYAFYRRPLTRKAANWIAATSSIFFWFAFLLLRSAAGEKPGSGIVWVLMFFVSRWIMTSGAPPADPMNAGYVD